MAIATNDLTFGYGVMKVQSKLSELRLVTLTAEGRFVGLEQKLLLRLFGEKNDSPWIRCLTTIDCAWFERELGVRVNLVASNAG